MDQYELELAFYRRLTALVVAGVTTARPDELFEPEKLANTVGWRRGVVLLGEPATIGFGNGIYSRIESIYQIDLYVPRANANALKQIDNLADSHVEHFFPANGRGLTLTENTTAAHMVRRPNSRRLGREGAYLRSIVEVEFYSDVSPS